MIPRECVQVYDVHIQDILNQEQTEKEKYKEMNDLISPFSKLSNQTCWLECV